MPTIPASLLQFLKELKLNNNREWFTANKAWYQTELGYFKTWSDALLERMYAYDNIESLNLFRIYRDVRFSKDKSPYKPHFSGHLTRATKWLRGGYYFHIEAEGSFLGGGFWDPEADDLKRIRRELAADPQTLRQIIADPSFIKTFGTLQGERLKGAPQGYAKDHPAIDLLQLKQFLVSRAFTDEEVLAPNFLDEVVLTFRNMRPFFDYMSEVLTTDENGVPIED